MKDIKALFGAFAIMLLMAFMLYSVTGIYQLLFTKVTTSVRLLICLPASSMLCFVVYYFIPGGKKC